MRRSLSIPEWHRLALEDNAPPVRIQVQGTSMLPLIRAGRDYVTVVRQDGAPAVGDIVLVAEPERDRYVMHRVWAVGDGTLLTWGDNCPAPDDRLPLSACWGRAALIERGKRQLRPDPKKGLRWARFWHRAGKLYRLCRRCAAGARRRLGNFFS